MKVESGLFLGISAVGLLAVILHSLELSTWVAHEGSPWSVAAGSVGILFTFGVPIVLIGWLLVETVYFCKKAWRQLLTRYLVLLIPYILHALYFGSTLVGWEKWGYTFIAAATLIASWLLGLLLWGVWRVYTKMSR